MIYYLKYDIPAICKRLIQEQLEMEGLNYVLLNMNEVEITESLPDEVLVVLNANLEKLGIEIVSSQKSILVQKIKAAINEMLKLGDQSALCKTSHHLAQVLHHDYRYLSKVFSEVTYTNIESYIILQKVEKAKEMIACNELSFTEIAWKLNYSSVGHFSMQFKNTTGLTPSLFKRIIMQRRSNEILDVSD